MLNFKRKKFLLNGTARVLIALSALLLLRCGADKPREVIQAMSGLPSALLPSVNNSINAQQIYAQIYETLLTLDQDFKALKPNLCRSWRMDSAGTAFTFYLRSDVWFHDGSKFNAYAVKKSVEWLKEQNKNSRMLQMIKSAEALNDSTVVIILNEARPAFIYAAASPSIIPVLSAAAIEKYGRGISRRPVGSGPFKLESWQDDKEIILKKYEGWWKADVNIERIVFKGFKNYSLIEESLKQNKTDIVYAIRGYSLDRMKWMGKVNYAVNESIGTAFIGFNLKNSVLSKINVRKALAMSLNANKIVTLINRGNADISNNPLPKVFLNDKRSYNIQFNPVEAKKLLAQEGYAQGLKLNLYYPKNFFTRLTYIEAIKTAFKKVGISLNITAFDSWSDLEQAMSSDSSQIFIYGWGAEILGDAGNFLRTLFYSGSPTNFFHYYNKEVDNILDRAQTETDAAARDNYYRQAVQLIMQDIPAVFLMHVKEFYAYNKEKIKSVTISPYGTIYYDKIILR